MNGITRAPKKFVGDTVNLVLGLFAFLLPLWILLAVLVGVSVVVGLIGGFVVGLAALVIELGAAGIFLYKT